MRNVFRMLQDLLPQPPLQVGTVTAVDGGTAVVTLPGGGTLAARGDAFIGQQVFVRGGVIEAQAPALDVVPIEI